MLAEDRTPNNNKLSFPAERSGGFGTYLAVSRLEAFKPEGIRLIMRGQTETESIVPQRFSTYRMLFQRLLDVSERVCAIPS